MQYLSARVLLLMCLIFSAYAKREKPNVIVILTDDQGWGDLSMNGNRDMDTPHIDSIAKNGAQFKYFYVQPVCSPTRAEFLTGRYHERSSVYSTSEGGERIDSDEQTIADMFKASAYKTAAFGKWHNGMQYPYHPNARGFDEFYGFCSGHWGNYYSPMLERNNQIVPGQGFIIDDFTNKAIDFIEKNQDNPFFVYLPYATPHSPMQIPDRWWDKYDKKDDFKMPVKVNNHLKAALAMCENIDYNVGRLLKKLDELNLSDDTIVLYMSDNGPNGDRWNGGMRGRKGSVYEGGLRSPLVIQWPRKIPPAREVKQISGVIDLMPTLADLCDVKLISEKALDGRSMKAELMGSTQMNERYLYAKWSSKSSIRNQKYRFNNEGKLYDIENDPGEKVDISKKYPLIAQKMKNKLQETKRDVAKDFNKNRPFVITHPDSPFSQLPARDAKATGTLKRSSKHPNCSFWHNWETTDDYIYWDGEVEAEGNYEAVIYYTCKEGHQGSVLELSFAGNSIEASVDHAHDPPLKGMDEDHTPRIESYVKDFRPLNMGVIKLEKGKGVLQLKALKKTGEGIIDFRLLTLKRIEK
ncbi:N-acetylgalactosamine 6-sulfatase (GALNS) [Lentisphaera araneosa HTCC2155]|uniref:N-acetylgalactosamine 6-sulfatase (GALNS) n=1 Tax=Lentisphaera araneosa HTCC2155 TaxID=313628 RepID=A6DN27_9BACT|nr:arylsulfatase [Lentisphaera araneosa]EDM27063.1 N-acetylgalactosamine 6-sulfatase (GALNS) [Lentisphaera araneosa HTCC2155]